MNYKWSIWITKYAIATIHESEQGGRTAEDSDRFVLVTIYNHIEEHLLQKQWTYEFMIVTNEHQSLLFFLKNSFSVEENETCTTKASSKFLWSRSLS